MSTEIHHEGTKVWEPWTEERLHAIRAKARLSGEAWVGSWFTTDQFRTDVPDAYWGWSSVIIGIGFRIRFNAGQHWKQVPLPVFLDFLNRHQLPLNQFQLA